MQDGFGGCLGDLVVDMGGRMAHVVTSSYHTKTKRGASIDIPWRLDQSDAWLVHVGYDVADGLINCLNKTRDKMIGVVVDNRWTDVAWLDGCGIEVDV